MSDSDREAATKCTRSVAAALRRRRATQPPNYNISSYAIYRAGGSPKRTHAKSCKSKYNANEYNFYFRILQDLGKKDALDAVLAEIVR
jgi:hypothetical protein